MTTPGWWEAGVRVVAHDGKTGTLERIGPEDWLIRLDDTGGVMGSYVVQPEPARFGPEVRQGLTGSQLGRIVHDCERALLRAFGCHYIPEWEALPETVRTGRAPHPKAVGRPELGALQALVRGAIIDALAPYTSP